MKKIAFLLVIFPFILTAQMDTSFSKDKEIIHINQKGINDLVSKYKKILRAQGGVEGWRIQIAFKAKREDILTKQAKFTRLYPKIPAQIIFDSPYYKLTVGNFRYRNQALKIQDKIKKSFPAAHPVPVIIDPELLTK